MLSVSDVHHQITINKIFSLFSRNVTLSILLLRGWAKAHGKRNRERIATRPYTLTAAVRLNFDKEQCIKQKSDMIRLLTGL